MATAYDSLLQAQTDAKAQMDAAVKALSDLQTNPAWTSLYAKWSNPQVQSGGGWIDASGVYWGAPDAIAQHTAAKQQVLDYQAKIKTASDAVTNTTNAYNNAVAAITNYEKNSPVGSAIVSAAAAAAKSQTVKNIIYIVVALTGIGIIISLVRWFEKRKTKSAPAASA